MVWQVGAHHWIGAGADCKASAMLVDRIASLMTMGAVRALRGLLARDSPVTADYLASHLSALCEAVPAAGDVLVACARSR